MNEPELIGLGFCIRCKVDDDHAAGEFTNRSRVGYLSRANVDLVYWFSKKHPSVEISTFGSEFVTMKLHCEQIRELRCKLKMIGIPVEGTSHIEGDNQSVLVNTNMQGSFLKKKS